MPVTDVMPAPGSERESYLGDGLYASFDGFQVKLRAPRPEGDQEVYLDQDTMRAFWDYVHRTGRFAIPAA